MEKVEYEMVDAAEKITQGKAAHERNNAQCVEVCVFSQFQLLPLSRQKTKIQIYSDDGFHFVNLHLDQFGSMRQL